jgi:hypothetical protein
MDREAMAADASLSYLPVFTTSKENTMRLLTKSRTLLASLALAGLAGGAHADLIEIDPYIAGGNIYSSIAQTRITAPVAYQGQAALWNVTNLDTNTSFLAYCLQMLESVDTRASNDYTSGTYTPTAGVQELYDRYYGTVTQSIARAVGFQLALWELTGQAAVASFQSPVNAIAEANLMLNGVTNGTTPYTENAYTFVRWSNDGLQDVLQAVASNVVPEPQTHALLLGGLGLMAAGMAARRRKHGRSNLAA